jgi:lactoylglutathione lyase
MKMNHVAIYVADLEKMKSFYETYFLATANTMYHNPKSGLRTYFLAFEDGSRLEIMNRPDVIERNKEKAEMGLIHLAFGVGSETEVDKLTATLKKDGYEVLSGPRRTGDGYYESCVLDPEGNQIEIVV